MAETNSYLRLHSFIEVRNSDYTCVNGFFCKEIESDMPVSKKRKRAGKVVTRQAVVTAPDVSKSLNLKIKPSQMIYLKNDPDFLMMVKMGRILNAILYAVTSIAPFMENPTHISRRQYRRGLFVLAGYLHESINILRTVEDRHITMESFIPLRNIAHGVEYKKAREYLREIRNVAGFHLADSGGYENTKQAISELKLSSYELMGGDDNDFSTYYFELSDILDISVISKKFEDERDPELISEEIHQTVNRVAWEFIKAATHFQVALARKMDLHEYVYGQKHKLSGGVSAPINPPPTNPLDKGQEF